MRQILNILLLLFFTLFSQSVFSQGINVDDLSLFYNVQNGDYDGVKNNLDRGADPNSFDADGYTPIMYAADICNLQIIKVLMDNGANPNILPLYDSEPPALHAAVLRNSPQALDLLLKYSVTNVNFPDSVGNTALYYAVYYGYLDCAKILISHNANLNISSNKSTLLQLAAYFDDVEMMDLLLQNGAKINEVYNNHTAFSVAVERGNIDLADSLINYGANANLSKPVLYSAAYSNPSSLEYLKDVKSDFNVVDSSTNFNAADFSIFNNNYENFRLLKNYGLKPTQQLIFRRFSISEINEFTKHEGRIGLQVGLHESHYNFALYAGISARPAYKPSFNHFNGDENYYQLREKRKFLYFALEKRFAFSRSINYEYGASVAYQFAFTSAKFDGSIDKSPESQRFNSPCIGLYSRFYWFGISAGYKYYDYKYQLEAPKNVVYLAINFYLSRKLKSLNKFKP